MTCKRPAKVCLGDVDGELTELATKLGKPRSLIVRDAVKLYKRAVETGKLSLVMAILDGYVPVTASGVNININIDQLIQNIAETIRQEFRQIKARRIDVNLYAADIDTLRGVFRQILSDVMAGNDVKTAVAKRIQILEKISRKLAKARDHPELSRHYDAVLTVLGALNGNTSYEQAISLLREYALLQ